MIGESSIALVREISKLAYQYGPFLFAIIFILFVTRWAHKIYNKACIRKDPPASEKEKTTCRIYFLGTAGFSCLLVLAAILWWLFNPHMTYKFEGRIEDLKDYQKTVSHSFYLKPLYIFPPEKDSDLPVNHHDHFIIVKDKPFEEGEIYDISIYNTGVSIDDVGGLDTFEIKYSNKDYVVYKMGIDPKDGKAILVPRIAYKSNDLLFPKTAIASDPNSQYQDAVKSVSKYRYPYFEKTVMQEIKKSDEGTKNIPIVEILQDERSSVAEKQKALSILQKESESELNSILKKSTPKEPMILTFFDLARHTDPKISYLAKNIVDKRVNTEKVLFDQINYGHMPKVQAEDLLLRIEKDRSESILSKLSSNSKLDWVKNLAEKIRSGQKEPKLLVPSGSIKGDRYYVMASWDPKNMNVVNSLTELFHRSLIHNRTIEQERKLMQARDKRYVYWYSKEWALGMAQEIENIGAQAKFVGF